VVCFELQVLRVASFVLVGTAVASTVSAVVYLMTSHRNVTWFYVDKMASKIAAGWARLWMKMLGIFYVLL